MNKQKGFSLIELLIVVAIILIIAAIAIPNLLTSRMPADEASAVGSLRTINTAQITYASTYPSSGFASTLGMLGPGTPGNPGTSTNAALLDNVLGCGTTCTKSGYSFVVAQMGSGTPVGNYTSNANPTSPNSTGRNNYYSDASGVIRNGGSGSATSASSAIQ